jgi:photosynthetic reaction center cytochrome c subunit
MTRSQHLGSAPALAVRWLAVLAVGAAALAISGCDFGPKVVTQNGHRGTGMQQVLDADLVASLKTENAIPPAAYPPDDGSGPRASAQYQNVQVLGHLSEGEFNRVMASISEWVVPQAARDRGEGCSYCHNPENLASDEVYQKVVARRMLQMTMAINTEWTSHVQQTGVTCWTCHRGNAVPLNVWANAVPQNMQGDFIGSQMGQNRPVRAVGWTTSPTDALTYYLGSRDHHPARVQGSQSLRPINRGKSINKTEYTLGVMQHMSNGLGVNCSYCHNTQSFATWSVSRPARVVAWHGLQMVPTLNQTYMDTLQSVFQGREGRVGPMGDVYKVGCTTCHQGAAKPLNGVSMRNDFPEFWKLAASTQQGQSK